LLLLIGGLIAFLLWPYHNYKFRFDPQELLERYVDTDVTMAAIYRELAVRIKHDLLASVWPFKIQSERDSISKEAPCSEPGSTCELLHGLAALKVRIKNHLGHG
jgi:hypothetical protein